MKTNLKIARPKLTFAIPSNLACCIKRKKRNYVFFFVNRMVVFFQDGTSKNTHTKGNQGQGASYNLRIGNCIIHNLASSRYVINILNMFQFANGEWNPIFTFDVKVGLGFFWSIFTNLAIPIVKV